MKLPRWLVVSLIVSAAFAFHSLAGWWWFTWPARTLQEFTLLVEQGRLDEANRMLKPPSRWVSETFDGRELVRLDDGRVASPMAPFGVWQTWCSRANLQTESRSIADLIHSRQPFSFHNQFTTPFFIGGFAERGRVAIRYEPWAVVP